jgi:hypothetical protein
MKFCRELRIRRGPAGMTDTREAWASIYPATHLGPDQVNVIIIIDHQDGSLQFPLITIRVLS